MISIKRVVRILIVLAVISFIFLTSASLSSSGIELATINYKPRNSRNEINVNVIKVDRRQNRVVVLDSRWELDKKPISESFIYSLRNLYNTLNPVAIINGGFTASYELPIPVGLIVHDGRTISQINKSTSSLQNGIFCIIDSRIDGIRIIKSSEYGKTKCFEALQNGPLIITNGRNNIGNPNKSFLKKAYSRSIVAIDRDNKILFIQTEPISLSDLVELLVKNQADGGLSCVSALNLSGSTDSGMILKSYRGLKSFGSIDSTVPSVILAFPRKVELSSP